MLAPGVLKGGVKLPALAPAQSPAAAAADPEAVTAGGAAAGAASAAAASAASAQPAAAASALAPGKPDFDAPGVRGCWGGPDGENPFPVLIDAVLLRSHAGRAELLDGLTRVLGILRGQTTAAVLALLQAAPATFLVFGKGACACGK